MRLRNKKTGEIVDTLCEYDITKGISFGVDHHDGNPTMACYNSLAELNEDWEDYEEPKSLNEIDIVLDATREYCIEHLGCSEDWEKIKILNIVEEKLKAFKRLKDKGFRFKGYTDNSGDLFSCQVVRCSFDYSGNYTESRKDLNLLFGGEE